MKILYFLGAISCFALCGAESDVNEYCEEQCKNVCIPRQEPVRCTQNQTDCGLGEPDENFGGVCPPHSICVEPEFHCKITHNNDWYNILLYVQGSKRYILLFQKYFDVFVF